MAPNFNPPEINNQKSIIEKIFGIIKGSDNYICLTGENNSGKSFLLRIIKEESLKFGFHPITNRNTPGSKDNFNDRVFGKEVNSRLEQLNLTNYNSQNSFNSGMKGGLESTAFSHSTSLLFKEENLILFDEILQKYFIKKDFFGNGEVQIKIMESKDFVWTIPEEEKDVAHALCFNGEHYHWSGEGLDGVIFLISELISWKYIVDNHLKTEKSFMLFLDEPERGLSIKNQKNLRDYIFSQDFIRTFPFVKKVFVATHSHVFIPYLSEGKSLFVITKDKQEVRLEKIKENNKRFEIYNKILGISSQDLMVKFFLFIEGLCDLNYISKILELLEEKEVFIVKATGGSPSVFSDVFSLVSREENPMVGVRGLTDRHTIEEKNNSKYNEIKKLQQKRGIIYLIELEESGIEFYYPLRLIKSYFDDDELDRDDADKLICDLLDKQKNDENKIKEAKKELNNFVSQELRKEDLEDEMVKDLISALYQELI